MTNKTIVYLFAASLLVFASASARKPNVILIFTDDQGSIDMNCYGSKDLKTPHMDALAESGVRFTQFYAAAPVCSPSRAGLLTGRTPQHGGVPGNIRPGAEGMPSAQVTIAEELKSAGYATAHIGKWHLGHLKETLPNAQGFDHSFGHELGCIDNYSHFFYWNGANRHDLWRNGKEVFYNGVFFQDLMVKEAGEFMETNQDKPFFIYYAVNAPHYPYQGDPEWLDVYKDLPYPRNLYAAFLSTTDDRIGRLMNKVQELGLSNDTIVIFQSDHGHSEEDRAHGGGGNAGPYRGSKFSLYEGGIRVPAIISWPGTLPKTEVRDQLATGSDWYPTILELCGVPAAKHELDGRSIVSVIKKADAESPHKEFHWKYGRFTAVRLGDWKLLQIGYRDKRTGKRDYKIELYDLSKDVGEAENLADKEPDQVKQMKQLSENYWKRFGNAQE